MKGSFQAMYHESFLFNLDLQDLTKSLCMSSSSPPSFFGFVDVWKFFRGFLSADFGSYLEGISLVGFES